MGDVKRHQLRVVWSVGAPGLDHNLGGFLGGLLLGGLFLGSSLLGTGLLGGLFLGGPFLDGIFLGGSLLLDDLRFLGLQGLLGSGLWGVREFASLRARGGGAERARGAAYH
jgi:hypothetical protein